MSTKTPRTKFKKCKGAPKRFKSAFMFYSAKRHREIRGNLADNEKMRAADISKLVSQSWKKLRPEERAVWDEMARKDKVRYEREKALYKGPWKVPDIKYPDAPKKPMSAFLAFSNARRKQIAEENPLLSNAQISSLLSKLWKECPADVMKAYRDKEAIERENFKRHRAEWELKKQREAGVNIPMEKIESRMAAPSSLERVRGSQNGKLNQSQNSNGTDEWDDWESWMSGSDVDSEGGSSGADTSPAVALDKQTPNTHSNATCHRSSIRPPFLPPMNYSDHVQLPKLLPPQQLSMEESGIQAILDNEELFEDFSPLDASTTAPFVDRAEI